MLGEGGEVGGAGGGEWPSRQGSPNNGVLKREGSVWEERGAAETHQVGETLLGLPRPTLVHVHLDCVCPRVSRPPSDTHQPGGTQRRPQLDRKSDKGLQIETPKPQNLSLNTVHSPVAHAFAHLHFKSILAKYRNKTKLKHIIK